MKSKLLPVLLVVISGMLWKPTFSQDQEIGLFLGTAQYQGDLSMGILTISETQPSVGAFYRYYLNPWFNFKGNLYVGYISGDDKNFSDESGFRKRRNLRFRSHVLELSGQIEWNIIPYVNGSENNNISPYVFAGAGVFNFSPKADFNGETYDLRDLGTEGQGIEGEGPKYNLIQISIPYGIGLKYSLGKGWNLGLEVGHRITFTDYLDDVSTDYPNSDELSEDAANLSDRSNELDQFDEPQFNEGDGRGNPDADDLYIFTGFTISKTIRNNQCTGDF